MAFVDIDTVKKHVRADDGNYDDELLTSYLEVAEDVVISQTYRPVEDLLGMNYGEFPPMLRQAVIMLVAHWYNQREDSAAVQYRQVPFGVDALIKPYQRLV